MSNCMNDTLYLIALGIGYLVLYFARREEKRMQFIGYIIGAMIIIATTAYMLLNLWLYSQGSCPMKQQFHKGAMYKYMPRGEMQPWLPKQIPQKP